MTEVDLALITGVKEQTSTSPFTASHCPARDIPVSLSEIYCMYCTSPTLHARAFAIAGQSAWNSLPDPVRNPNTAEAALRLLLKTFLFPRH